MRHIRDKGAMRACLSTIDLDEESLVEKARQSPPMENRELASVVTTKEPYEFPAEWRRTFSRCLLRLRRKAKLAARTGATRVRTTVVPASTPAAEALALKPRRNFPVEWSRRSGFDEQRKWQRFASC